jgi:hypothetical protein
MRVRVASYRRSIVSWSIAAVLGLLCVVPVGVAGVGQKDSQTPVAAAKKATKKKKRRKRKKDRKRGRKGESKSPRGAQPPAQPPAAAPQTAAPAPAPEPAPTPDPAPAPPVQGQGPGIDAPTPLPEQPGTPLQPPGVAPPPQPRTEFPIWRGGFETGDFSQWKQLDGNLEDKSRYFGLVTNPVAEGRYAFRSTVDAGAVGKGESGQRAMLLLFPSNNASQNATGAYEGGERWYRTQMYFPADFKAAPNNTWNWVLQWHNWPDGPCCSNISVSVDTTKGGEKLSLRVMGGGDQAHPVENNDIITERNPAGTLEWFVGDPALQREHWYDSVVHIKWSADPSKGLAEWWLDGKKIMSKTLPTLYWYADNNKNTPGATPGPGQAYYMEGYYRPAKLPDGSVDTSSASVYFDGAQMGPTPASIGL